MPAIHQDSYPKVIQALSACNTLSLLGATNAIWSGNAATSAVISAILSLPLAAGITTELQQKVASGIQAGVDAGIIAATHGYSTLAGAAAAVQGYIPEYPVTYNGFLPQ